MKINLLIVDDIEENIYALEVLFEELEIESDDYEGLNIFKAVSGEEALRQVLKEKIDLILLDVRMPGMDGFQVAEYLKLTKKTSRIPIVFLTAEFKSDDFVDKGYKVGALDYFIKPIEKFQFLNKMKLYINLFLAQKVQAKQFNDTLSQYMALIDQYIISSDIDLEGTITRVSQAFCDISGYQKGELVGSSHQLIRGADMSGEVYKEILHTLSQNRVWHGQIKNQTKNNEYYWTESVFSERYDRSKNKIGYTSIERDITDKKKLEKISITDGLTELFNRRHFDAVLPKVLNGFKRNNKNICFALIDIDYFKRYNDTYGHQMGDDVLKKVADIFRSSAQRADDYCFRIGGEEFCIVFCANDKYRAYDFMVRIKSAVEDLKIRHSKNSVSEFITVSIGLTCKKGEEVGTLETLFHDTDNLLYKAKETGRNRVVANFV